MRRGFRILLMVVSVIMFSQSVFADQNKTDKSFQPWERFGFSLGGIIATTDSNVRLGLPGIGFDLNIEDVLGLDSSTTAVRVDAFWRFTQNRRHRFDFSWFDLNRDATKVLLRDITIDDTTFPLGTTVYSSLDLSIIKGAYSYSIFQDDRFDLAALFGLYVMPIDFKINSTGGIQGSEAASITAPLPVIGLRGDFAITPKFFIRTNFDLFYLKYKNFKGRIIGVNTALEYKAFKNVGFGLGFDALSVKVEAEGDDYPGVNFIGNIGFAYSGIQLYAKIYFP